MYENLVKIYALKNIKLIPVETEVDACNKITEMIPEKSSIGYGGSVTLEQIGILDKFRQGDYVFYDRNSVIPFTKESSDLGHQAQRADYFISGSNAITEDGAIVNKDRTGNRVSALIYGPEHVIVVVGKNKITKNVNEALERIKTIAAPMNAKRKNAKTPCVNTGVCTNCNVSDKLCCNTVIIERQFKKGRMTVILINKDLGY